MVLKKPASAGFLLSSKNDLVLRVRIMSGIRYAIVSFS